ncbi:MAG: Fe-S cluster assembly protein SufD [Rikenellaceae bacterium]|jgi:Fe-S cluster assembly protein SufD|nr:Fe-S cluster assembly protein SufD [Rikenellaceae bacterium]
MRTVEQKLEELYLSNLELIGEGFPAAFNGRRKTAVEQLRLAELPGAKDERYHLTDIRGLYDRDWEYYFTPPAGVGQGTPGVASVAEDWPAQIIVNNGFADGTLREEENGVVVGSLRAAAAAYPEIIAKYYAALCGTEALAALNGAFVQDGLFIYIPENVRLGAPIVAGFGYGAMDEALSCFSRSLIVVGPGAKAEISLKYSSRGEVLANNVCEIVALPGADVSVTEFVTGRQGSVLLHSAFVCQSEGSRLSLVAVAPGGGVARMAYRAELAGPEAEFKLGGLYLATADEQTAFNVQVEHQAPDCRSDQVVKGVVSGHAVGSFTGRVLVARGAQRTAAMQQSRNIELSQGAKIYTRPQLEIYADDVKCSHGATVGQLDDDAIYYMRQRGIDLATARRLQLEGFIGDVTQRACHGCEQIDRAVQAKLAQM